MFQTYYANGAAMPYPGLVPQDAYSHDEYRSRQGHSRTSSHGNQIQLPNQNYSSYATYPDHQNYSQGYPGLHHTHMPSHLHNHPFPAHANSYDTRGHPHAAQPLPHTPAYSHPAHSAHPSISHTSHPSMGHSVHPTYAPHMPPLPPHVAMRPPPVQNAAEPPVAGGINSVLDYDLATMADFVAWCGFGMLKQARPPLAELKSLLTSVLYATRLSRSTIIVALEYMNQRYCSQDVANMAESDIFPKIITALVLANKFNDDNTFTNRSWCGATGLLIDDLNREEREWLKEMRWQLSVVLFEHNIRTLEDCWATWLDKYTDLVSPPSSPLSPYHQQFPSPYPYTLPYEDWSCRNSSWSYPMYAYHRSSVGYTNPYYGSAAY